MLRSGFTLNEILVVLGIIVLLLGIAVPAFNFISGNRSQEAAQNTISAMINRARMFAVESERQAGVVFYVDRATQLTSMAIVMERPPGGKTAEDPYRNYKGWSGQRHDTMRINPFDVRYAVPATYEEGQESVATVVGGTGAARRIVVNRYFTSSRVSGAGPGASPAWAPYSNVDFVDFVVQDEIQTLPSGVGCQLINDPKIPFAPDRYVRTGVILFDPSGRLVSIPISIHRNSQLGGLLGDSSGTVAIAQPFTSQLGVVLYDQDAFRSQDYTENDNVIQVGWLPPNPTYNQGEEAEEMWLDDNASQLLIGRYTGTILKGE